MKNLEITLEQAREIFEDNGTPYMETMKLHFGLEVLKPVKKLPSSCFGDLIRRPCWYIGHNSDLFNSILTNYKDRCTFAKKEQAEAVLALAQLSHHMEIWNDGWVADWTDVNQSKSSIHFHQESLDIDIVWFNRRFLVLKDTETAKLFLETFKDLIEQAKPLL